MNENYNFERNTGSDLVPDGDYEVIIEKIEPQTISTGKQKLQVQYRIRSDVDGQRYGNKCLFESIWKEKEGNRYNHIRINQLLCSVPDDELKDGTNIDGIEGVIKLLKGRYAKAHIIIKYDDYYKKDVNDIKWFNPSEHLPQTLGSTSTPTPAIVNDDDLPF